MPQVYTVWFNEWTAIGSARGDHVLADGADALDPADNLVAGTQVAPRRASHPDACRGAGEDDVPGQQGGDGRQVADQVPDGEDQLGRAGLLHALPVDSALQGQVVGIGERVRRHQPRPGRAETGERLAERALL